MVPSGWYVTISVCKNVPWYWTSHVTCSVSNANDLSVFIFAVRPSKMAIRKWQRKQNTTKKLNRIHQEIQWAHITDVIWQITFIQHNFAECSGKSGWHGKCQRIVTTRRVYILPFVFFFSCEGPSITTRSTPPPQPHTNPPRLHPFPSCKPVTAIRIAFLFQARWSHR